MNFPTFGKLAHYYAQHMASLYHGHLWDFVQHPELVKDPVFRQAARQLAGRMVGEVAKQNAKTWRAAAMKSTRAREIYRALQAEIESGNLGAVLETLADRNAELISSVPADIAERITKRAVELHQKGSRPAEIERDMRRWAPELSKSRIRCIARTELSRAETDLTRERSARIGIDWYQWETSEDQRVRPSHKNMDHVLVAWNDPPSPEALIGEKSTLGKYHAGCAPNCRCPALPLADVDEVRWPCRVYRSGSIVRMTRPQFLRVIGVRLAA
jgi:SPP1 gp7 family putative phage head morphogenesis protein